MAVQVDSSFSRISVQNDLDFRRASLACEILIVCYAFDILDMPEVTMVLFSPALLPIVKDILCKCCR